MFRFVLICALIAFASSQTANSKSQPMQKEFEQWLRPKIEGLNKQVMDAHKDLKNKFESYISEARKGIDQIADSHVSLLQVSNVHEKCLQNGLVQLEEVKKAQKGSMFTCSNLTQAIEDIGDISWYCVSFVSGTLVYLDDILNGMVSCTWDYYLPPLRCYFSYMTTALGDMTRFIGDIRVLTNDIANKAADIKKQVDWCRYGPQQETLLLSQKIVRDAHQCSKQYY